MDNDGYNNPGFQQQVTDGDMEGEDEEDLPTDEELLATKGDWDPKVAEMNTIHLIGRIGNNPEPRYFDDGNCVVNLSLACTRKVHYMEREAFDIKYGDEPTDWYGLEIWGAQAEFISKFVDKGARVAVTGSLQIDEWNDKETGELRNSVKVIVREFDVLETKAEAELRRGNSGREGGNYSSNYSQSSGNQGQKRGASFYVNDPDDEYNPRSGGDGGFFN